jgi:hypothetical protein
MAGKEVVAMTGCGIHADGRSKAINLRLLNPER